VCVCLTLGLPLGLPFGSWEFGKGGSWIGPTKIVPLSVSSNVVGWKTARRREQRRQRTESGQKVEEKLEGKQKKTEKAEKKEKVGGKVRSKMWQLDSKRFSDLLGEGETG
jgi:membrane protein implicated in regulation of membrane protease activity